MTEPDLQQALFPIVRCFEELGIPYFIGGSIASSVYGIARATIDVDLVAEVELHHVDNLKTCLQSRYYIDEMMITEAIEHGSSFNLIHLETSIKIDVFISDEGLYSRTAMGRRRMDTLKEEHVTRNVFFCSTEDIILHKLKWYESGGGTSERQWFDVLGVIKVQSDSLDKDYLRHWSKDLGLSDLLQKAFQEGGVAL